MLRFKMITFDATNTLIKVRQSVGYHYARVAEMFSIKGEEDSLNREFKTAFTKQRKDHPNFGKKSGISSKQWWGGVLQETFRLAGHPIAHETFTEMNDKFYEYAATHQMWEVYPEVKEMLTFLNRNGVCLGVLSDNDERLVEILRNLDIANHFAFILPSIYAEAEKPDSSLFKLALDRLQIPPEECVHIGDSFEKDFEGARTVGIHPLLIDRNRTLRKKYPDVGEDHFINDITGVEKILFKQQLNLCR